MFHRQARGGWSIVQAGLAPVDTGVTGARHKQAFVAQAVSMLIERQVAIRSQAGERDRPAS
jgi:hypothetical protein